MVPKRRGRPATGRDPVSAIRLSPTLKSKIDNWAKQQEDQPSRSGAIRRLLNLALNSERTIKEAAPPSKVPSGTKNDTESIVAIRAANLALPFVNAIAPNFERTADADLIF